MLIEFQERYDLKNRELALLCGCSLPTVQKWRSGHVPLPEVVHRFLAVLDAAYQGDSIGLKCFVERAAATVGKDGISAAMVEEFAEQTIEAGCAKRASLPATRTPDELMVLYNAREDVARTARKSAEEAERLRDQMLAEMSYQLRTPMNSILGAGQMLRNELQDGSLIELADAVLSSGKEMMHVINSLGLFSGENMPDRESGSKVALIAEDNMATQMVLTAMLRKQGFRVERAGNGVEAVRMTERQQFDCIFMDIQMPVMDGVEAVREIRRCEKKAKRVPAFICATTAYAMPGDREKYLAAGMDVYLAKPISLNALSDVIQSRKTEGRDES